MACRRVGVSACRRVGVSACQRVSVSACQRVSVSACQRVSVSACQRVSVSRTGRWFRKSKPQAPEVLAMKWQNADTPLRRNADTFLQSPHNLPAFASGISNRWSELFDQIKVGFEESIQFLFGHAERGTTAFRDFVFGVPWI
jgi:hypothetical protein